MGTNELEQLASEYYRYARRLVKVVVGFTLLVIGIALIVLPGPAIVVIPIALAILAGEFVWARKLLKRVKREIRRFSRRGSETASAEDSNETPGRDPDKLP